MVIIIPIGPFVAGFIGTLAAETFAKKGVPKIKKAFRKSKAKRAAKKAMATSFILAEGITEEMLEPVNTKPI